MKAILNVPRVHRQYRVYAQFLLGLPKTIAGVLNTWEGRLPPKIRIITWFVLLLSWSETLLVQAYQGSKIETMAITMDRGPDELWSLADSLSYNSKTKKYENDQH
ncbi:hypothetical protein KZP23_16710 [Echinicola marina]|uniref:hypothetical protein n=1 Tax=Echinicola marina TaxID=2859768 RepID=UPI001CF688DB|nr:hypothetical protein [Echinicola marina]UCS92191.1 hypothetical protein KZP23_15940 [Echinicola marina]UCS92331.1 hypothetical protein KZP23_16710 [Echinicola marina]